MKIILLGPGAYSGIYHGGLDFFSFLGGGSAPAWAFKNPEIERYWSRGDIEPIAPLKTPLIRTVKGCFQKQLLLENKHF